jgi:hypothetical protein
MSFAGTDEGGDAANALVALMRTASNERRVGLARIISNSKNEERHSARRSGQKCPEYRTSVRVLVFRAARAHDIRVSYRPRSDQKVIIAYPADREASI